MLKKPWFAFMALFLLQLANTNNANSATESPKTQSTSAEEVLTTLPSKNGDGVGVSTEKCTLNCLETVCTESKITFEKHSAKYIWRVSGLRKYIKLLENMEPALNLTTTAKLETLHPLGGEWVFKLTDDTPMELSATYTYTTQPSQYYQDTPSSYPMPPKDSTFEIILTAIEGETTKTLDSKKSTPTANSYFYQLAFYWRNFEEIVLETITDRTDDIELHFLINSFTLNSVQSSNISCSELSQSIDSLSEIQDLPILPPFVLAISNTLNMKDDKYADLTIKTGDEEYKVHRVILANSSPVFATMIFNKTFEKSESLLDLGAEIGHDVVEELIKYIYTGQTDDIDEIADRIIVAAYKYGYPDLKKKCESALMKQVRIENAFSMYSLAVEVQAEKLRKRAFNVMKENKSKIVNQSEEFRKLSVHHPEIMYELFLS